MLYNLFIICNLQSVVLLYNVIWGIGIVKNGHFCYIICGWSLSKPSNHVVSNDLFESFFSI